MNCYALLAQIKSDLGIVSIDADTALLALLEASSRYIDNFCNRFFYVKAGTRYYDGCKSPLLLDDVLSISDFKLDEDADMVHEATLDVTDYTLYPLNEYPKWQARISTNSNYSSFAPGVGKGIVITGNWGYGNELSATPYSASGVTVTADNGSETELDVSAEGTIKVGHTILVESEQIYVSAATSDGTKKITVKRGINGTTGAAHAAKEASLYEYPDSITRACIMVASRWFKRKDTAYANVVATSELGQFQVFRGLDPDVKLILAPYCKVKL